MMAEECEEEVSLFTSVEQNYSVESTGQTLIVRGRSVIRTECGYLPIHDHNAAKR